MYVQIVKPGVYRCSSIKAAEACKVIENTQRDLYIALMNELSIKQMIATGSYIKGARVNVLGLTGLRCLYTTPTATPKKRCTNTV